MYSNNISFIKLIPKYKIMSDDDWEKMLDDDGDIKIERATDVGEGFEQNIPVVNNEPVDGIHNSLKNIEKPKEEPT